MKNEKGFITIDYLFAFVLTMGLTGILFAFTLSLTVIEMTQYLAYVGARQFAVAQLNEKEQQQNAEAKMRSIVQSPVYSPLYTGNWFKIGFLGGSMNGSFGDQHDIQAKDVFLFRGVQIPITMKVLDFNIPFFGSTASGGKEEGFKTTVTAYIGSEPNYLDCFISAEQRYRRIVKHLGYGHPSLGGTASYVNMIDNGC